MNIILEVLRLLLIILYSYLEALVKLFIPVKRKSVSGEIVLITGAGHGIGQNTAKEFAKLQSVLVLWDINQKGLEETAAECRKLGAKAHIYVVDCSKREEINTAADKVKQEVGDITILVNNAGVIFCADVLSLEDRQIEKIFEVNIIAHFWTTRAFLPAMMKKNHGHIIAVASTAGFFGVPYMVDYCTTKFAALGYHKALTAELAELGMTGIHTSCVCPIFVNTGFVTNASSRLGPILTPEDVAKALVDGVLINKKLIVIPPYMELVPIIHMLLPERGLKALNEFTDVKFDVNKRCIDKDK